MLVKETAYYKISSGAATVVAPQMLIVGICKIDNHRCKVSDPELNLRHKMSQWSCIVEYIGSQDTLWTHWSRVVTHLCVRNLTTIGSDNGLSPGWCQVIIFTNAGILLIGPKGTNFSELFLSKFKQFHFRNAFERVVCKMASIFLSRLNVLMQYISRGHSK